MTDIIIDCMLDALKDSAISIPVLFVAYLLMELLEQSNRLNERILNGYSRKAGPLLGGLMGVIPQCGISGAAATLYSTGAVTVGTMLAVFFATSDEMLPVMLTSLPNGSISVKTIISIVAAKAALGIALGYIVDFFASKLFSREKNIHSFCERENCDCDDEGNVFLSALKHTVKIALMLLAVNFVLDLVIGLVGIEKLTGSFLTMPVIGELFLSVFGLIPNCSVSVIITEAYLSGIVSVGGLFAGLLSNAGIGLLVLLRTNRNPRENAAIIGIMLALSAVSGIVINFLV